MSSNTAGLNIIATPKSLPVLPHWWSSYGLCYLHSTIPSRNVEVFPDNWPISHCTNLCTQGNNSNAMFPTGLKIIEITLTIKQALNATLIQTGASWSWKCCQWKMTDHTQLWCRCNGNYTSTSRLQSRFFGLVIIFIKHWSHCFYPPWTFFSDAYTLFLLFVIFFDLSP